MINHDFLIVEISYFSEIRHIILWINLMKKNTVYN